MRQDCCGILPTFLSLGTHQGRINPYVTVNQKPLQVFSSLSPQRNVSFPQQKEHETWEQKHHFMNKEGPVEHHHFVGAASEMDEGWRINLHQIIFFPNSGQRINVEIFFRKKIGCFWLIYVLNHNKRVTIESWITIVGYNRITRFWFGFWYRLIRYTNHNSWICSGTPNVCQRWKTV